MFISHEITCFYSIKRVYKRNEKNLENDFKKLYIYITRLNLMLLLVLTSISVVVAARQKQKWKSKVDEFRLKNQKQGRTSVLHWWRQQG